MAYVDGRGRQTIASFRVVTETRTRDQTAAQAGRAGAVAATLSGCAAAMSYRKGFEAGAAQPTGTPPSRTIAQAVQEDPDKPEYRIALERAMLEAALIHASAGKDFEAKGELDAALREYKRASEYDPANRQLAAKVAELDRMIRDAIEASRPRSQIAEMRDRARRMSPEPILNPASREPLDCSSARQRPRHPEVHRPVPPASTSPSPATTATRRGTR